MKIYSILKFKNIFKHGLSYIIILNEAIKLNIIVMQV